MSEWKWVVLFCTALLCEPVWSQEKWSRAEGAEKRIDDWVPITATCPTCKKNLEPNESGGTDEIGSLLNPPAIPSGRAFNLNSKQNNFKRAPAGEPYEITTPQPMAQFFNQQQPSKIPQSVHFPVPFFGQNLFQTRFQGPPNFQPQFTFIPQPQLQALPKENKVTFPDSPFIQQQNKGSVQLVYVPIEALQRQKPRLQADRSNSQQPQIEIKTPSPFETGKLKFQRPPQPYEPTRFPTAQQFEQQPNRFMQPPTSFEQDTGRFPSPSQLFDQGKPNFSTQLKEQRPEFLPQNEQPVAPQSYQFVEDVRNPSSNFFQFHENRFQKPSFEENKPKESKPEIQNTFIPNFDESRQESSQSFVSNFDVNNPRLEISHNIQSNFQETRPRQELPPQNFQQNFQETRPIQEPQTQSFQQNFQETRPRQERPQNIPTNFQETKPRQEPLPPPPSPPPQFNTKFEEQKLIPQPQFIPNFQDTEQKQELSSPPPQFTHKFEEPKVETQQQFIPNFQETKLRQESLSSQFTPKFEEPKVETQQQFIPNFQETKLRQESLSSQFTPKFEEPKVETQQQFIPNFQETKPRQELSSPPPQFIPKFEEPKLEPQQQFISNFQESTPTSQFIPKFEEPKKEPQPQFVPNFQEIPQQQTEQQSFASTFESLGLKPEVPQFVPNFQETRPIPNSQESFLENFEKVKPPKVQLSTPSTPQQTFNLPSSTEQFVQKSTSTTYPPPHQPPLSVYMEKRLDNRINDVLTILKDAKTIPVLDTIGNRSPKVFVGPSDLDAPRGYVKFELPYLSSLDITKIDSMVDRLPFFVAPLNFKPPFGYAKIPFPPPHIGSVVVSSKTTVVPSSTEFIPFTLTSQLPTEVNSLQPSLSSTTERVTENSQKTTDITTSTPKRNRQRKPLHRGSLTSFSTTTPINDITERQKDEFTTPSDFKRLPEILPSVNKQQSFLESTPTPNRQKSSRKPNEHTTVSEPQAPIQQKQFDNPQQQFFSDQQVPQTHQNYLDTLPQLTQQSFFNNQQQPSQQPLFENQQQPSQQPIFDNQQYFDNPPQSIQDINNPQSLSEIKNQDRNQQQFISSSTEKQIFKNFQQIQPLSQYHVGNNFLNQQQSSTEQVQLASNPPQTVSVEPQTIAVEPQTVATVISTEIPKLRQRLSYYDKLQSSSTQEPVEISSPQNFIESSEKPRERPKLKTRQRLTTTKKPTTETSTSEEVSEQITESSTQRYNPLKRRRLTTTTTTEQAEVTRNPLRSRTTQANRSDFVRSRSRRPLTTTTTTTSTTTTESAPIQKYEEVNDVQITGQEEQKKIEEAASFWNEPVTIQQSHSYELETKYTQAPTFPSDGKFSSGEPPADEDLSKEKYGNEKKAHDLINEKKAPGRRGHWVRVRVKKPQDNLDTAESQNSLGPLSVNAIQELVTKPTLTESSQSSQSSTTEFVTTVTESTTPSPTTPTVASTTTSTTTTTTTTASPPLMTTMFDNTESITEEHLAETTIIPSSSSPSPQTVAKYPDDEQDEAFQRNLADMLAKFIGGGTNESQDTTETTVEELTAETQYAGSEVELTVTPSVVTEVPTTPVTSTTTKVSMETEICYRGRCVKSKKNKKITDLVSEP